MPLRQRLLLRVIALLFFAVLVASLMVYARAADKVQTELKAAMTVGEQLLDDAVHEIAKAPNPYQAIRIVIERFSGGRHLKVALIDKSGAHVAESKLAHPDEPAPQWFYRLMKGKDLSARVTLPKNVSEYPEFLVEADPHNEIQEAWEDLQFEVMMLGVLAIPLLLLIYWTVASELRPLEHLSKAMSDLAEGDYGRRVPVSGAAELVSVAQGFNGMAERLDRASAAKMKLEAQLSCVQEEERADVARDLHDEIGPLLFSVGIDTAAVQQEASTKLSPGALERLAAIRSAVGVIQKHVLQILSRLRTGTVEDLGLAAAVDQQAEFWKSRLPGLAIEITVPPEGIGEDLDPVIYRVIQESLSNSVRHGKPNRIDVMVARSADGTVRVTVSDDGGGLKNNRPGNGLTGMRERVEAVGGTLSVRNGAGRGGTIVMADIPLPKPLEPAATAISSWA